MNKSMIESIELLQKTSEIKNISKIPPVTGFSSNIAINDNCSACGACACVCGPRGYRLSNSAPINFSRE